MSTNTNGSIFSKSAVETGSYTKFLALTILAIMTLSGIILYGYLIVNNITVPPLVGTFLGAGVTFFVKAAGIADGASISQNTIQTTVPSITDAVARVAAVSASNSVSMSNAVGANTQAMNANTQAVLSRSTPGMEANTIATKENTQAMKGNPS